MSKELYIDMVEEIMDELTESGMSKEEAYDLASEQAYDRMIDRLAAIADGERMRRKEQGE